MPTNPIINEDLGVLRQGLCIFIISAKSYGFYFLASQIKNKPYAITKCVAGNLSYFCAVLIIA